MNRQVSLSRHLRLVLAAALATPVAITLAASPARRRRPRSVA